MTKYQKALEQIEISEKVIGNIRMARGEFKNGSYNPENDKAQIIFWQGDDHSKPQLLNEEWTPAILFMKASYGYYGSPNKDNAMTKDVAYYLMRAIQSFTNEISLKAIKIAKEEMDKAKSEAKEEAKKVLEDLSKENYLIE